MSFGHTGAAYDLIRGFIMSHWRHVRQLYLDVLQLEELGHVGVAHHPEEGLNDVCAAVSRIVQLLHTQEAAQS